MVDLKTRNFADDLTEKINAGDGGGRVVHAGRESLERDVYDLPNPEPDILFNRAMAVNAEKRIQFFDFFFVGNKVEIFGFRVVR